MPVMSRLMQKKLSDLADLNVSTCFSGREMMRKKKRRGLKKDLSSSEKCHR